VNPLVSTEELARGLARSSPCRLFDCRHDLLNPALGERQYAGAHIPGALFAHLDRDLSAPKIGSNGRHPLPDPAAIGSWLGTCGVKRTDRVVAYDANNGTMAARLWWTLRWLGHAEVAVLDGGYAKWVEENRPVTAQVPAFAETKYEFALHRDGSVDVSFVERNLGNSGLMLLDARAAQRWRGATEPIDPVAGRIPGAHNRFCGENLGEYGTFKNAEALRREFGALLGDRAPSEIVHY